MAILAKNKCGNAYSVNIYAVQSQTDSLRNRVLIEAMQYCTYMYDFSQKSPETSLNARGYSVALSAESRLDMNRKWCTGNLNIANFEYKNMQ